MEGSEFLLKWNNHQSNLHSLFTGWWKDGSFVDCTLVIERREIPCHRIVLSAFSPFFENLLITHSAHPHPLIILHDVSYEAVHALLEFMYRGEVHVSKEMLSAVVKAAKSLKIKGISDSAEIAEFNKELSAPVDNPVPLLHSQRLIPTLNHSYSAAMLAHNLGILNGNVGANYIKPQPQTAVNAPVKKRRRVEEPFTLSPRTSIGESENNREQNKASPQSHIDQVIKQEHEDEVSENELHIDESALVSSSASSSRCSNTPGVDTGNQDYADMLESAQSLASLATHGETFNILQQHQGLSHMSNNNSLLMNGNTGLKKIKTESRSNAKKYTSENLNEAVAAVLDGNMPPAKAIALFGIPRRTFFRKLSNERKARGITTSRENASDTYLSSPRSISPAVEGALPSIMQSKLTSIKNWEETAKTLIEMKAHRLLNIKQHPGFDFTQNYIKSLSDQRQKENEGTINDSRPASDPVCSSNSSEKPLGEKNTFDN